MDRIDELGSEQVSKLLWKYSLPPIVGMIVFASYNIVDRYFVGQALGAIGNSAITVLYPMTIVLMAFGMLCGFGGTSLVSISFGEQKRDYAAKVIGNTFMINTLISAVILIFSYIYLEEVIIALGGNDEIMQLAKDYGSVLIMGAIFGQTSFAMNNIIRSLGSPMTSMMTMLISAILNIILNPLFIMGFNMGIKGSAWATVISQMVSCTWVVWFYLGKRNPLRLNKSHFKFDFSIIKRVFGIGSSSFFIQIGGSIIATMFNHLLNYYSGSESIAIYGIAIAVLLFVMMPVFGLNQGAQPIIGYNFGAKNYKRVQEALRTSLIVATLICTIGCIVVIYFSHEIMNGFLHNNPAVVDLGTHGITIFSITLPVVGLQVIASGYYQSIGKSGQAVLLTLLRQVIVLIPLLIILPPIFGLEGVWFSPPIADFVSAAMSGYFLVREIRKLSNLHLENVTV